MAKAQQNVFDRVHGIFERHVDAEPRYLVACSLWALHTHVFQKHEYSPRLALLSPVPNCGKSTVLSILNELVWKPEYLIDPTPPSIFRMDSSTFLLDEADNLLITRSMKAILNAYKVGSTVPRVMDGVTVQFPFYAPVALAAIGTLPGTLISRALVIHMQLADPKAKIVRFYKANTEQARELALARSAAIEWAAQVQLNPDPSMPKEIGGRNADNWRVLFAIADSLDRGEIARKAAIQFTREYKSPDIKISLLQDIRTIFDEMKTRILPSSILLDKLLDEYDWADHRLTQNRMSNILRDFQIYPQNLWWPERKHRSEQKNLRCYVRSDFEGMWRRYATTSTTSTTKS